MALAETANLIVNLGLKGNFARDLSKTSRALGTFDSRLDKSESRAYRFGQQIGTGIRRGATLAAGGLAFLAGNVAIGLNSLIELEQQVAQTNAVLKSTKGAAGITAKAVGDMAESFENVNAIVGDEFIRGAENMLLTFTNIRKKAFEPSLQAILDLNTAMGKGPEGLTSTAIQVGKALNDPTTGLTALRRVGVSFTASQVAKIKSLQKEGKLYEAQRIILKELNKEFGGSFARQGATTAGRIAKFRDSVEDLQRALAKALLPTLGNVADALSKLLADPKVIAGVESLGKDLAGLFSEKNLASGAKALGDFFDAAKEAAPGIIAGAKVAGQVVATAVKLFQSLPPEIQKLAIGALAINKLTGGLVTNVAGGLISAVLKQLVSGVVNVQGAVVNVAGGVGGLPGGAVAGKGLGVIGGIAGLLGITVAVEEAIKAGIEKGAVNTALGERGLNAAEIAAIKYYQSSIAEQQIAAKRLGYIPTKADFDSAMAKLGRTVTSDTPKNTRRDSPEWRQWSTDKFNSITTSVENLRRDIGPSLSKVPGKLDKVSTNTVEAGVTAKNASMEVKTSTIEAGLKSKQGLAEVKAQSASNAMVQAALLGSQIATTMTTGLGTQTTVRGVAPPIVSAIQRSRPIITTIVNVTANHVTKQTTIQKRYGPGTGSSGQDQRSGELEF